MRIIVTLLSAGWVVPLGAAGWLAAEAVALIGHPVAPASERFDRLMWARGLLAVGFGWLSLVAAGWAYAASGREAPRGGAKAAGLAASPETGAGGPRHPAGEGITRREDRGTRPLLTAAPTVNPG